MIRCSLLWTCLLLVGCAAPKHLAYATLDSPAMGREMEYSVYTPPGWSPSETLPLVVFLHGGGDGPDCFDEAYVGQMLDAAIAAKTCPRVVVCVPDGELGFWENWFDGSHSYRDWVVRDLIPHVRKEYHTLAGREHTHLMGISMGGHGTLRFALKDGNRFASAAVISAPIMDTDATIEFASSFWWNLFVPFERIWGPVSDRARIQKDDLFLRWRTQADLGGLRLMLVHGTEDNDGVVLGSTLFHEHLERQGVEHRYLTYEGGHKWVYWKTIFVDVLQFLVGDGG